MDGNTNNEVYFYQCCDEEYCDMGSCEFECPVCKLWNVEYGGLWYEQYNSSYKENIECQGCKTMLQVFYNDFTKGWEIRLFRA